MQMSLGGVPGPTVYHSFPAPRGAATGERGTVRAANFITCIICILIGTAGCSGGSDRLSAGTPAPATPQPADALRFEYVRPKMGGPFRVVLYAPDEAAASRAAEAAFARVDELNAALSDYQPESELSRLSQRTLDGPMAEPVRVSEALWHVLRQGQAIAERTGGAFDVTVGPYMRLWRRARELGELPTRERLEKTRASVGHSHVRLDPEHQTVQLTAPRMRLDVGGLALGYIADEAVAAAAAAGAHSVLVDAGGEISVGEPPPGKDGWVVGIQSLKNPDQTTGEFVKVRNACVTSSGDTRRFVEIGGRRYSHIIDPRTGLGLTRRIGATVVAPDGMTADALDTAVCVLGPERGLELVEQTPGAAARITTIDGERVTVYESTRFRQFLTNPPEAGQPAAPRLPG
jgi:thiamine biosynthesis lipoprotein